MYYCAVGGVVSCKMVSERAVFLIFGSLLCLVCGFWGENAANWLICMGVMVLKKV